MRSPLSIFYSASFVSAKKNRRRQRGAGQIHTNEGSVNTWKLADKFMLARLAV
jgi:hypothetical protein